MNPRTELPQREPEPLHLPIDDVPAEHAWRRQRGQADDQDVTGSHVIVIDLE